MADPNGNDLINTYLREATWLVRENANMGYSVQGLNNHLVTEYVSKYWLEEVYPLAVGRAHTSGDLHIHNLGILGPYCVGWDLRELLTHGFRGVGNKIESRPPKHFSSALGQVTNFLFTLQGEAAGAQAFSNFDTLLAGYVVKDKLSFKEVRQQLQEFLFNANVPTRVGFQTPFTNITFDLKVPDHMKGEPRPAEPEKTLEDQGDEMNTLHQAYLDVMLEGDGRGRIFPFPIPTYNVEKDFPWDDLNLWRLIAKYGSAYFSNFIRGDLKPEDARSMCCRLRLDMKELVRRGGALFGANALTGSIGVVTLNLPRLAKNAKSEDEFYEKLGALMNVAKDSLEVKREFLERMTEGGLYPYSRHYLTTVKTLRGEYWGNHFSTIGIIGMHEAAKNLINEGIETIEGTKLAVRTLQYMREKLIAFQEQTETMFNLEATPAESTAHRLAAKDGFGPDSFYTNSSHLPVDSSLDLFEALQHQNQIQPLYTGGTVFHVFIDETGIEPAAVSNLIKKTLTLFDLPYVTFTPTFSVCPSHGYTPGSIPKCLSCGAETERYSRVVGYYRPVSQWNQAKQREFEMRHTWRTDPLY